MNADLDVSMAEPDPPGITEGAGSNGHAAGDTLAGPCCIDVNDEAESVRGEQ